MDDLAKVISYLSDFATKKRITTLDQVLSQRTNFLTVVVENIYQPQNASATIRTCDCFGIQKLHIIENNNQYNINPDVVLGSTKWVDLIRYNKNENNTKETIDTLKSQGYRIIATSPHTNDVDLPDFDITKGKSALIFGTELTGVSDIVKDNADEFIKIPMYGFTESFNISVSVAVILYQLTSNLRNSKLDWKLNEMEKNTIKLKWILKSLKKSPLLLKEYCSKHNINVDKFNELL